MHYFKNNFREVMDKKQLLKWKKKKKEELVSPKKDKKTFEKEKRKKFKQQLKNKKVKIEEKSGIVATKKRMRNEIIILWLLLAALIIRIGWIQFGMGEELQSMAYVQQTLDRSINPKRGTIYDSTEKNMLAVSSTVETITVNPVNIAKENERK